MKVRDALHRHAPPSSKPLVGRFLVRLACAQVLELVFDIRKDAANGWTEENQDPDDDDRDQRDDEGILDQPLTTIPMEQTIQHACSLPPSLHSDVYGPALAVGFGNRTLPIPPGDQVGMCPSIATQPTQHKRTPCAGSTGAHPSAAMPPARSTRSAVPCCLATPGRVDCGQPICRHDPGAWASPSPVLAAPTTGIVPSVPTGSGFDPHGPSLHLAGRRFPNVGTYPSRTHVPEGPHAGRLEKVRSQRSMLGLAVAARCWGGGLARIAGLAMGARIIRVAVGAWRTVRVAMGAWRVGRIPLAVLLPLLLAVLLREVRDALANPVRTSLQLVLAALHLLLDLLTERALRRRGRCAGGAAGGEQRRQDGDADLALEARGHRGAQPTCHVTLLLVKMKTGGAGCPFRRPNAQPSKRCTQSKELHRSAVCYGHSTRDVKWPGFTGCDCQAERRAVLQDEPIPAAPESPSFVWGYANWKEKFR